TETPVAGALALLAGIVLAWRGANLFYVSLACCTVVFVVELLLCH
ncbi:MAG: AzlD domain-containing protein, partial [bacterium]|nr:AzlD domain-containing protein [bacterium]